MVWEPSRKLGMAILSPPQTDKLLQGVGAVSANPRLPMGLITWKGADGKPVAGGRCEAILTWKREDGDVVWAAADPEMLALGVPCVAVPKGMPARQGGLVVAAARGLAQLALAGSDAEFIHVIDGEQGLLFLGIYGFFEAPRATAKVQRDDAVLGRPAHVVAVRAHVGPRTQILSITFETAPGWLDTGLDPVMLATRPLLVGHDNRMLWFTRTEVDEPPEPLLVFRHVEDGSSPSPPAFRYASVPSDPPLPRSGQVVPLGPSARVRFPDTPGRIEVRFHSFTCESVVDAYQGYFRLMLMMHRAGPRDLPHRSQLDDIQQAPWEPGFEAPDRLPEPEGAPVVQVDPEEP